MPLENFRVEKLELDPELERGPEDRTCNGVVARLGYFKDTQQPPRFRFIANRWK